MEGRKEFTGVGDQTTYQKTIDCPLLTLQTIKHGLVAAFYTFARNNKKNLYLYQL